MEIEVDAEHYKRILKQNRNKIGALGSYDRHQIWLDFYLPHMSGEYDQSDGTG